MTLPDRVIDAAELAEILNVTRSWVMKRCRTGEWPHLRVRYGKVAFLPAHVERVLELLAQPVTTSPAQASGPEPTPVPTTTGVRRSGLTERSARARKRSKRTDAA